MNLKRFLTFDWEAIAGIIAAVAAIVLNLLQLIDQGVLISIAVVLIALLFVRDLRRDRSTEQTRATIEENRTALQSIKNNPLPPYIVLIRTNPPRMGSERFAANAKGEMIWFHVCLSMFRPQPLFDTLLRPAIENPLVTQIQFILDESQKALLESEVLPKIGACKGRDKVLSPRWTKIKESVSVIITDAN